MLVSRSVTHLATSFYWIPQVWAALRLGMDWTSVLLWVEVLLAAFSSGLVFGLRSGVWSLRSSRGTASRSGSTARPAAGVAALEPEPAPEPVPAVPGRVPPAPVPGPPTPPIELAVPAQASAPVRAEPRPPVGAPAMPNPERHRELYAAEYTREIQRLKRLRGETSARLSLAAQAEPGRESAGRLDDPPVEVHEEGPGE